MMAANPIIDPDEGQNQDQRGHRNDIPMPLSTALWWAIQAQLHLTTSEPPREQLPDAEMKRSIAALWPIYVLQYALDKGLGES